MNTRLQHAITNAAAALAVCGGLLVAALPARAGFAPAKTLQLVDIRPNLKVQSSLSEPILHLPSGQMMRVLQFTIRNDGLTPAPVTTTSVTIEAGDPFSPISTAIALQNFGTPALAAGATSPGQILLIPDTVYIKVDLRADAGHVVNERTEHDNHRVHSVGYAP
jgi:hypothetical protein